ncbi:MAG: hypothetical protein GY820_10665 [Gammaproteobacteria bacterium]|nr:hypothetical protein [Gammaproteobacteria bacterium]
MGTTQPRAQADCGGMGTTQPRKQADCIRDGYRKQPANQSVAQLYNVLGI